MRLVEDHRVHLGQDAGVGGMVGSVLDGQVGEEQVVIDNDDVAAHGLAVHFGDEAAVKNAALLSQTGLGTRVELVPQQTGLGKRRKFRPVSARGGRLPCGDRPVLVDFLESGENRAIRESIELLAA